MGPLIPLAVAAAVVVAIAKHKPKSAVDTGIRPAIGPVNTLKGRSGLTWDVQMVEAPFKPLSDGGSATMQVILNEASNVGARRHMVIEYLQTGAGSPPKRTLVRKGPSTSGLIQAAIADFGVTGPAAEAAAKGQ
jgi:hypothetical protein